MFALLSVSILTSCNGWGSGIHREITEMALREIRRNSGTMKFLRSHLGDNDSIIRSSTWADSDEAAAAYPDSDDLHFSNTPWRTCGEFNITRDCGLDNSGRCIVSGIADFALIAADPSQPQSKRVAALKFLIHLVADIHQPLHTGFSEDNGGVNIQLASNPVLSLHQMWDFGIWETESTGDAASPLVTADHSHIALEGAIESHSQVLAFASKLATESSTLLTCDFAYKNERANFIRSKQVLSPDYIRSRREIIGARIALAGHRLANVLGALAATFAKNSSKRASAVVAPTVTSVSRTNMYTLLPIEFEPDDYIEEVEVGSEFVARHGALDSFSPTASKRRVKNASRATHDIDLTSTEPLKIGKCFLTNITLTKCRERYVVTCKSLVDATADYDPMYVQNFRVRFTKNRKRTDPIVFLADYDCFGTTLTQHDFLIILYHLSGNDVSLVPASSGSSIAVYAPPARDLLDFEAIRGEYFMRDEESGRIYRGWNRLYERDTRPVGAYLNYLEQRHSMDQLAQHRWAKEHNKTMAEKWDLDFYTKIRDIVVYRVGKLQVVVNRNTLIDPHRVEMHFVIYGCISKTPTNFDENRARALGEDPQFTTLIDVNIFDGYITERILKGLSSIIRRALLPDAAFLLRPTFFAELLDLESMLHGQGTTRNDKFQAIQGFYMFPSVITRSVAYIEWSIIPTMFQPVNETAATNMTNPNL